MICYDTAFEIAVKAFLNDYNKLVDYDEINYNYDATPDWYWDRRKPLAKRAEISRQFLIDLLNELPEKL